MFLRLQIPTLLRSFSLPFPPTRSISTKYNHIRPLKPRRYRTPSSHSPLTVVKSLTYQANESIRNAKLRSYFRTLPFDTLLEKWRKSEVKNCRKWSNNTTASAAYHVTNHLTTQIKTTPPHDTTSFPNLPSFCVHVKSLVLSPSFRSLQTSGFARCLTLLSRTGYIDEEVAGRVKTEGGKWTVKGIRKGRHRGGEGGVIFACNHKCSHLIPHLPFG